MDDREVDIKYEPIKEIVILDRNHFDSSDDLARFASIVSGGKVAGLNWAEGVVFLNFVLPASTETAAKALMESGRVYWTLVGYALMPKYQPMIETKEKIMIPIIDLSSNSLIRKVANWLKQQKE
jgi:ABC-type enterochelin transport system permease subunit